MRIHWKLHGYGLKNLAVKLLTQILNDDVFGYAAQLSFYFLFSLFPLMLCMVTLLGFFAETGSTLRINLLNNLAKVMPVSASELVVKTLDEISASASSSKFSVGLLIALWTASSGMGAIINSLNIAYSVDDTRPWWKTRLISLALTIAFGLFLVVSAALLFYGGSIGEHLATSFGLSAIFSFAWKLLQWPSIIISVLFSFSLVYHFGPNLKRHTWQIFTPGAVAGLTLWVVVSLLFRLYLQHFNTYSKTYGSLGAVMILLLWFYLTGTALLIGGEINSELEKIQHEANTDSDKQ